MKFFWAMLMGSLVMVGGLMANITLHKYAPVIYTTPEFMMDDGVEGGWGAYAGSHSHIPIGEHREVVQVKEDEKKAVDEKLYEVTHLLRHYEGKEEERLQLEQYVDDLKNKRTSVNIDHIINDMINKTIKKASEKEKVPQHKIRGIIKCESEFNPIAVSHAGAKGLMQLMPGTAQDLGVKDVFDIEENIMAGTKHYRFLLDKYNWNYTLATAAYNAGHGNVDKYGGIPPFKETQDYVPKVAYWSNVYKNS